MKYQECTERVVKICQVAVYCTFTNGLYFTFISENFKYVFDLKHLALMCTPVNCSNRSRPFGPDGCQVPIGNGVCGEKRTLDFIYEFKKLYMRKMEEIDANGGGDCMQVFFLTSKFVLFLFMRGCGLQTLRTNCAVKMLREI